MRKKISLLLILALLLSLCGCASGPITPITTAPTEPEQITAPYLTGQQVGKLAESEDYRIEISQTIKNTSEAEGTILGQAPVGGAKMDKGATVYVIVTTGGPAEPIPTEPESTEPQSRPTQPTYTEPALPEQTDPPPFEPPIQEPQETDPTVSQPPVTEPPATEPEPTEPQPYLDPNGTYTSKSDVALYIYLYHQLPGNFVTKKQAKQLYGWSGGSLSKYGKCIGGDRFYNNEGLLPSGQTYYECDIDTLYSSSRGAKRLVYTKSGIVYYTDDHYESFTRLY